MACAIVTRLMIGKTDVIQMLNGAIGGLVAITAEPLMPTPIAAILIGAGLSAFLAPPALVMASGTAFLLSEFADFAVYTPLQRKRLILAVFASSLVGLVIDSIVFLYLAFGSLDYLAGQVLGKAWMVLIALPFIWWLRQADMKRGIQPA